jgi:hypothetical protein
MARKLETTLPIVIVRIDTTIGCFQVPTKNTKILYILDQLYHTCMSMTQQCQK